MKPGTDMPLYRQEHSVRAMGVFLGIVTALLWSGFFAYQWFVQGGFGVSTVMLDNRAAPVSPAVPALSQIFVGIRLHSCYFGIPSRIEVALRRSARSAK
jgi:hypothetical protein